MILKRFSMVLAIAALTILACSPSESPDQADTGPKSTSAAITAAELSQRTIERRAIEAVIWGLPAVNYDRMYAANKLTGGFEND